jgi:tripartite ATP-independent transporter DctP family solute receptor
MISRQTFVRTGVAAGAALAAFRAAPARAAEFTLKFANDLAATHPMNVRAAEMAKDISNQSGGRVEIQLYPGNQLGSDTGMLTQIRSGAIDLLMFSPILLGVVVPVAQINGVGFAFDNYDKVWAAMDGELGAYVRAQIAQTDIFAFERMWDNGYRQVTTSTHPIKVPGDFAGMKFRVPVSPLWVSMFTAFGAAPTSIPFSDVYTALQTKLAEGQENPLAVISTGKLYEVQKYCSLTNHMWDGYWCLGNKESFARLPPNLQKIVRDNINAAALKDRKDVRALNESLVAGLTAGLTFNTPDRNAFRATLRQAGFYSQWHDKFGNEAWSLLEKYTGKLS